MLYYVNVNVNVNVNVDVDVDVVVDVDVDVVDVDDVDVDVFLRRYRPCWTVASYFKVSQHKFLYGAMLSP